MAERFVNWKQIYERMVQRLPFDMQPAAEERGSATRSMLESMAVEIEEAERRAVQTARADMQFNFRMMGLTLGLIGLVMWWVNS